MVTEVSEQEEIKTIHESVFWDEDDPRLHMTGLGKPQRVLAGQQVIDLSMDSYIWTFCGTRGAGKTLTMTRYAGRAVVIWGMNLVSNYPIKFTLNRIDGTSQLVEAEPLDLYKLLCFEQDYQGCLIIMDEAPDIISHLAAMTWKNRLLNIFVRQLRKNRNSLFLGSQWFSLIDKSMRQQVDIIARCKDAFRLYGSEQGLARGALTLCDIYDNSGQWTGHGANINHDAQLDFVSPEDSLEIPGKPIWGAFDTFHQQDVWESLARVDMHFQTYSVGKPEEENTEVWERTGLLVEVAAEAGRFKKTDFYDSISEDLTRSEKNKIGSALRKADVETKGSGGKEYFDFDNFNRDKFMKAIKK